MESKAGAPSVRSLQRAHRDERGQVFILMALAMGVLMGMAAVTIDVGIFLTVRSRMQSAADAAALAGAQELPAWQSAEASVFGWAEKNGFTNGQDGTTVGVATPYDGNPDQVEVTISKEIPFIFGRVLGKESITIGARAVAGREVSGNYAIFGASEKCDKNSVELSSGSFSLYGNVHSNAEMKMTGGDFDIYGFASHVCGAHTSNNSKKYYFSKGLFKTSPVGWPLYYEYGDFECTPGLSSSGDLHINPNTYWYFVTPGEPTLKSGVYCAEGDINLNGSGFDGQVTFVARGQIHLSGSSFNFTPSTNNVVVFSEHDGKGAIQISSSSFIFKGIFMATQGEVTASISSMFSTSGSILGDTVDLSGSSYDITADDQVVSTGPLRLLE